MKIFRLKFPIFWAPKNSLGPNWRLGPSRGNQKWGANMIKHFGCVGFIFFVLLFPYTNSNAVIYGGVDFPDGASSFVDQAVSYTAGSPAPAAFNQITSAALGVPDYPASGSFVSLGEGGQIVLRFTDNSLTGSGNNTLDLWIFEVGPAIEKTFVDISTDGLIWHSVGYVAGATAGVDIDAYGFGTTDFFSFVRLTDDLAENFGAGDSAGADIDAVGAISSAPAVVPEPTTLLLFGAGLIGLAGYGRKKLR